MPFQLPPGCASNAAWLLAGERRKRKMLSQLELARRFASPCFFEEGAKQTNMRRSRRTPPRSSFPTLTLANFVDHFTTFEAEYERQLQGSDEDFSQELIAVFNWLKEYAQGKKTPAVLTRFKRLEKMGEEIEVRNSDIAPHLKVFFFFSFFFFFFEKYDSFLCPPRERDLLETNHLKKGL
jgi:hypothetical protein